MNRDFESNMKKCNDFMNIDKKKLNKLDVTCRKYLYKVCVNLFYCFCRNLALNRAPDTYVKLNLVSSTGQELAHSKTTVRRGQPNPLFKETFVFQVSLYKQY